MAITSRTAAARANPQHQTIGGELSDPFFQFIDFTFSDEEGENRKPVMDITEAADHIDDFPFDLPSPIPLREINFNQPTLYHPASGICPHTSVEANVTDATTVSTIEPHEYNNGPGTTTSPKPEDVLSVRGVGHSRNPGNMKFRELVNSKKIAYDRNPDSEFRKSLAVDVVAKMAPGRFLKKSSIDQRVFKIMDYEASVTKALFAIRDLKKVTSKPKTTSSSTVKGKRKRKVPARKSFK